MMDAANLYAFKINTTFTELVLHLTNLDFEDVSFKIKPSTIPVICERRIDHFKQLATISLHKFITICSLYHHGKKRDVFICSNWEILYANTVRNKESFQ